jgi:hypothetical protein
MRNLNGMAEHVAYEVEMLVEIARRLTPPLADTVTTNAYLESFLIHARALDDFLEKSDGKEDNDVIARDYYGGWAPKTSLPPGLRKVINKRVAHLTDVRAKPHEGVQPSDILRPLLGTFCAFADKLSAGRWPEVDNAAGMARRFLADPVPIVAGIPSTPTLTVGKSADYRPHFDNP